MFEAINKGFNEAVTALQEVGTAIEQRLEEVFGTSSNSKPKSKTSGVVDATATPVATKKKTAAKKKAPAAKKTAAKKKAPAAKKTAAKKKAPATKKKTAAKKKAPAAKKKTAAKKTAAKKTAAKTASGPTRDELYEQAKKLDIPGRSKMTKTQLQRAITKAKS